MLWSPYLLLALASTASCVCAAYKPLTAGFPTTIDPLTATIKELNGCLESGSVTSEQLVLEYLARIERNNHKGLNLRAVIEPAPKDNVLAIARDADKKRKAGKGRKMGVMFGIPILVKDNYATDPSLGMNSTAGSFAFLPENAGAVKQDATVIAKLRSKGAIVIGKSNLSELSNFKANGAHNGWSARGGQTQTPYVLGGPDVPGGDPCGSSAGTGSGVAAGFAPAGLGTETDGSIVCPSNRHALYGLKPSVGVASRAGIIPISHIQDSPGPMAKCVFDLAAILGAMSTTTVDPRDEATEEAVKAKAALEDYTQFLTTSFKGITIGVPNKDYYWTPQGNTTDDTLVIKAGFDALNKMAKLGAKVVQNADIPSQDLIFTNSTEGTVLNFDFKQDIASYLSGLASLPSYNKKKPVRTIDDLIAFNKEHADIEMPPDNCCQEVIEASANTTDFKDPEYIAALANDYSLSRKEGLDKVFAKYPDMLALAVPTELASTVPALAGYPVATVPLGYLSTGQPFGLGFIGKRYDEKGLIKVMSAFEANFPPRRIPDSVKKDQEKHVSPQVGNVQVGISGSALNASSSSLYIISITLALLLSIL